MTSFLWDLKKKKKKKKQLLNTGDYLIQVAFKIRLIV